MSLLTHISISQTLRLSHLNRIGSCSSTFQLAPHRTFKHATRLQNRTTPKHTTKPTKKQSHAKMSKRTSYERSELGHTSTKRAKQVDENLPYDQVQEALGAQDEIKDVTKVAHWFCPKDLRIQDNTALHHASELAQSAMNAELLTHRDLEWRVEKHVIVKE